MIFEFSSFSESFAFAMTQCFVCYYYCWFIYLLCLGPFPATHSCSMTQPNDKTMINNFFYCGTWFFFHLKELKVNCLVIFKKKKGQTGSNEKIEIYILVDDFHFTNGKKKFIFHLMAYVCEPFKDLKVFSSVAWAWYACPVLQYGQVFATALKFLHLSIITTSVKI